VNVDFEAAEQTTYGTDSLCPNGVAPPAKPPSRATQHRGTSPPSPGWAIGLPAGKACRCGTVPEWDSSGFSATYLYRLSHRPLVEDDELYRGLWVKYYDAVFDDRCTFRRARYLVKLIRELFPKALDLLELACGSGRYTRAISRAGFHVVATDSSEEMLAQAMAKLRGASSGFRVLDMTKLHESRLYDVVVCLGESLRYHASIGSLRETFNRVKLALRPGGIFVFDFHHFPPTKMTRLSFGPVSVGDAVLTEEQIIVSQHNHDMRTSFLTIIAREGCHSVKVKRAPLLRISEQRMRTLLASCGFSIVCFQRGFVDDSPNSMLFFVRRREGKRLRAGPGE